MEIHGCIMFLWDRKFLTKLAKFIPHENVPFVVAILNQQNSHIVNMGIYTYMDAHTTLTFS